MKDRGADRAFVGVERLVVLRQPTPIAARLAATNGPAPTTAAAPPKKEKERVTPYLTAEQKQADIA